MITPQALRAARGLLNWGVRDLGRAAGVAWTTVSQFENGRALRRSTADKLTRALKAQGVELINSDGLTGAVMVRPRS